MTNWKKLIEEKREEIIKAAMESCKDALSNRHLKFNVEIDSDGDVTSWYDVAG